MQHKIRTLPGKRNLRLLPVVLGTGGVVTSWEVEVVFPFESTVVPRPGVTGPAGSPCGLGASGICCGFGPSGSWCCAALCCACCCAGCPSTMHTKAPANMLLLATRIPHTVQPDYWNQSPVFQITSAAPPPPSPT